jgi:hypothetical protein
VSFHAHIINCFAMLWIFYTTFPLSITLFHFEKDNRHCLSNSSWLRLVPCCWEKKNEIHQCGIPSTSWILGNKEPFVGLQNLCDSDLYVWWKLSKQFTTYSRRQSMANAPNKLKLQNSILEAIWLSLGICVSK